MADGTGTSSYGYDARDRLVGSVNGAGAAAGYRYDAAGNLILLTYPAGGQTVARGYDGLNRLTAVKDWLGHTTSFGYDDNSNPSGVTYPTNNGLTAAYGHDAANGLTTIVDSSLVGGVRTPLWSYGYTLDHTEQVGAVNDPVQPGAVQHTYARSGTGSGSTTSWGYDSAYRTTSRTDSTAGTGDTYTPDAAGELTSLVTKVGAATTRNLTLAYNAEGDRTGQADSVSGGSATYGYDQADRLTGYSSGSTVASYAYDGDGLRAAKTVNGTATAETWDVAESMPMLLQDGAMRYIYGPGGTPIEQVDGSGTVRYYLQDHLGSVRGLADDTGTVTDSYGYDPYGQRTAVTGSAADTPFGYAGQYTDAETGFQYLRARYYDPATGQFLSVDPRVDATDQPYAYAADNPVNFGDPYGLDSCQAANGAGWGRLLSAVESTGCSVGQAVGGVAGTAAAIVAPPCDLAGGRCRPPTGTEVATQLDQWRAATGSAVATTAQDVGTAIQPGCIPGVQSCMWQSPQEARQTAYVMLVGAYGALNVITYGLETDLGQYAGLPDLSCTPEFQRGTRLAIAAGVVLAAYGGVRVVSLLRGRPASSVWNLPGTDRGRAIELRILGPNRYIQAPNYPVIDDFDPATGTATSIKSLDLTGVSYQSAQGLTQKRRTYADSLSQFQGARWSKGSGLGTLNTRGRITDRTLLVVFERGAASRIQTQALRDFLATYSPPAGGQPIRIVYQYMR